MYLSCLIFFFKQKTSYEMRISDWSSDVCSSDLATALAEELRDRRNVGDVQLLTPEQGLQSLRDKGVPAPAIDAAGDNPLPYVLVVTPAGDEMMLAAGLEQLPEAELVQHDTQSEEHTSELQSLMRISS